MGIRLWKWMGLPAVSSLLFFAACDEHRVGEDAEVQKEHILPVGANEAGKPEPLTAQSPAAKPTPADFFSPSKP